MLLPGLAVLYPQPVAATSVEDTAGSLPVPASPQGHNCFSPREGTCWLPTPIGEGWSCRRGNARGDTPHSANAGKKHTGFWAQS